MADPEIAQPSPYFVEVEPGTYWWCSCGRSQKQPFCDGSHKGSEFSPVEVEVTEKRTIPWCGCKKSKKKAFCDGTHTRL